MNNLSNESFVLPALDDDSKTKRAIPISEARLAANRENAQHSTGAKTPEGKQIVSQNSTAHGLTGKFRVLQTELQSEFDELVADLMNSHAPANEAETKLVANMAETLWLRRRAIARQDRCLEVIDSGDEQAAKVARHDLDLYMRYQTTHERSYQRHAAELRKLQSDGRKLESGFVSQKHREADQQRKQERHEAANCYSKARLDNQLMKNRLLVPKVTQTEENEAERLEKKRHNEEWRRYQEERDRQQREQRMNRRKK